MTDLSVRSDTEQPGLGYIVSAFTKKEYHTKIAVNTLLSTAPFKSKVARVKGFGDLLSLIGCTVLLKLGILKEGGQEMANRQAEVNVIDTQKKVVTEEKLEEQKVVFGLKVKELDFLDSLNPMTMDPSTANNEKHWKEETEKTLLSINKQVFAVKEENLKEVWNELDKTNDQAVDQFIVQLNSRLQELGNITNQQLQLERERSKERLLILLEDVLKQIQGDITSNSITDLVRKKDIPRLFASYHQLHKMESRLEQFMLGPDVLKAINKKSKLIAEMKKDISNAIGQLCETKALISKLNGQRNQFKKAVKQIKSLEEKISIAKKELETVEKNGDGIIDSAGKNKEQYESLLNKENEKLSLLEKERDLAIKESAELLEKERNEVIGKLESDLLNKDEVRFRTLNRAKLGIEPFTEKKIMRKEGNFFPSLVDVPRELTKKEEEEYQLLLQQGDNRKQLRQEKEKHIRSKNEDYNLVLKERKIEIEKQFESEINESKQNIIQLNQKIEQEKENIESARSLKFDQVEVLAVLENQLKEAKSNRKKIKEEYTKAKPLLLKEIGHLIFTKDVFDNYASRPAEENPETFVSNHLESSTTKERVVKNMTEQLVFLKNDKMDDYYPETL